MNHVPLGSTGLSISPVVLGGNVFGWTLDESTSFKILDAFVGRGFNAIDTADVYSGWVPGNSGGESETIIGRWLKARPGMRDRVVIFTKVGSSPVGAAAPGGLAGGRIREAVEASLSRLGVDAIDLYFSHWPDPETPHEETLAVYDELLKAGKVKAIGASNYDASQLQAALRVAAEQGLPRYQVLQPQYNLYDRLSYEGPLRDLAVRDGLGVVTYFSLAAGFLSGKYRSTADFGQSARGSGMGKYLTPRGGTILTAVDAVAARHDAKPAEIALAWLIAREGVTAPIASATRVAHVDSFARAASLVLTAEDVATLDAASDPIVAR